MDILAVRGIFRLFVQVFVVGAGFCLAVVLWSLLQGDRTRKMSELLSRLRR
jgi:hypothetical protein